MAIRKFLVSVGALVGLIFSVFAIAAAGTAGYLLMLGSDEDEAEIAFEHQSGDRLADAKILAIRVDGIIMGEEPPGPVPGLLGLSIVSGYRMQEILEAAADDEAIKGVLVQFSTPGGTVNGSRAVHDAIRLYKEKTAAASADGKTSRPIIAHIEGLSASGGVMGMVPADEILAEPGSLIGSIGVRMGTLLHYEDPVAVEAGILSGGGVTTRSGIHAYTLAEGKGKDLGNPFRKPTEEELGVLRSGLASSYADFVGLVAAARGIKPEVIRDEMGAYVFGNEQAKAFGLIDGTATRREAFRRLAEKAGVTDYDVLKPSDEPGGLLATLLASTAAIAGRSDANLVSASSAARCRSLSMQVMAFHGDLSTLCR